MPQLAASNGVDSVHKENDLSDSEHCGKSSDEQVDPDVEQLERDELDSILMPPPNTGLGPRPTAASLGLKESIEECMAVPQDESKYHTLTLLIYDNSWFYFSDVSQSIHKDVVLTIRDVAIMH